MAITTQAVEALVKETIGCPDSRKWGTPAAAKARLASFFGCNAAVITELWNRIEPIVDEHVQPKHLLWGLVFLKVCSTEEVHCRIVGWPSAKTFREKAWHVVERIAMPFSFSWGFFSAMLCEDPALVGSRRAHRGYSRAT